MQSRDIDKLWNIYYHWKIDNASQKLLQDQLDKFIDLASTSSSWEHSEYGHVLKFADQGTRSKVVKVWRHCTSKSSDDSYKSKLSTAEDLRSK